MAWATFWRCCHRPPHFCPHVPALPLVQCCLKTDKYICLIPLPLHCIICACVHRCHAHVRMHNYGSRCIIARPHGLNPPKWDPSLNQITPKYSHSKKPLVSENPGAPGTGTSALPIFAGFWCADPYADSLSAFLSYILVHIWRHFCCALPPHASRGIWCRV